jgi:16S rRNA (guanine527-N7)-methyltransferase
VGGEAPGAGPEPGEAECRAFFGDAWGQVSAFADLLRGAGVERGLIGPREGGRLWSRHLVNCGAVAGSLPAEGLVVDLGAGAGLPGIVLAAMAPGVEFDLVEPMERRASWLREVVAALGLDNASVTRARAEELAGRRAANAVVARAVAPLGKLAPWAAPLLAHNGRLLAIKGDRAAEEAEEARKELHRCGFDRVRVVSLPAVPGVPPTRVVEARLERRR